MSSDRNMQTRETTNLTEIFLKLPEIVHGLLMSHVQRIPKNSPNLR